MISKVYWSKFENVFSTTDEVEESCRLVIQWITLNDENGDLKSAFTGPVVVYSSLDQVSDHAKTIAEKSFQMDLTIELIEAKDVIQINGVNPFSNPGS
jgi:hypothetical protein